jgi:DNA-directed RNA polymerase specialized sigma24 family protein
VRAPPSRNGNVLHGQLQARNHKAKLAMKAKSSRFDALVTRYYPAVYSFASRLTDDPREAIALTRDAFNAIRNRRWRRLNEVMLATILLNAVIVAGLKAA